VTLVWDGEDVLKIAGSLFGAGLPCKYLELPLGEYGFVQRDEVRGADGRLVGLSTGAGYSANERQVLSLAMVDADHAEPGQEVLLLWGEPNGGSRKANVERHRQLLVRATVAPAPYAAAVRELKRLPSGPERRAQGRAGRRTAECGFQNGA
jgi:vanillate/3-O-methylgallate O-demethylase